MGVNRSDQLSEHRDSNRDDFIREIHAYRVKLAVVLTGADVKESAGDLFRVVTEIL